jgi:hypothetical protein
VHLNAVYNIVSDDIDMDILCHKSHRQTISVWSVDPASQQRHIKLRRLRGAGFVCRDVFSQSRQFENNFWTDYPGATRRSKEEGTNHCQTIMSIQAPGSLAASLI